MPTHDRGSVTSTITSTQSGSSASCDNDEGSTTWPAHLKITGNTEIDECTLTVSGDVWITGNFELDGDGDGVIKVKEGLTTPPVIMVDGSDGVHLNNDTIVRPNSDNVGIRFITYWSAASCSPNCLNVTGSDLYNGLSHLTVYIDNGVQAKRSEFFARWSAIKLDNDSSSGALVGQQIYLDNDAVVVLDNTVEFNSDGNSTWKLGTYNRVY
jgi:hypothetical protein